MTVRFVAITQPSNPTLGDLYVNSSDSKLYFYNGSGWVDITGAGTGLWTDQGTYIYPNNYSSFVITDAGKVGIGTTDPLFTFRICGAGSTTIANNLALFQSSSPVTAGNVYAIDIDKSGVASLMMGINKNTVTGGVPASSPFISTYATTQGLSIGRGGSNDLPSLPDIYIWPTTGYVTIGGSGLSAAMLDVDGTAKFRGTSGGTGVTVNSSGYLGVATASATTYFDVNGDKMRIEQAKTPASAGDTGSVGDICWDSSYIYVAVGTNTWKRAALSTW